MECREWRAPCNREFRRILSWWHLSRSGMVPLRLICSTFGVFRLIWPRVDNYCCVELGFLMTVLIPNSERRLRGLCSSVVRRLIVEGVHNLQPSREMPDTEDSWRPRRSSMFHRACLSGLLVAGVALAVSGCTNNTSVSSIAVSPATQSVSVGETANFTATGTISHGSHPATTEDVTSMVTWTSSAPAVATVNSAGVATAVSVGTATITATMPGGSVFLQRNDHGYSFSRGQLPAGM